MPVGNPACTTCQKDPSHLILPCKHQTCFDCYFKSDDSNICGTCHHAFLELHELEQKTPTVAPAHPNDTTWSTSTPSTIHSSSTPYSVHITQSASAMMENNGEGHRGRSHNINSNGYRASTDPDPTSPTPGANNDGADIGRSINFNRETIPPYVPPAMRVYQPIVRPESSASNMSFQTQAPMPYHYTYDSGPFTYTQAPCVPYDGPNRYLKGMTLNGTTANGTTPNGVTPNGMGMNGQYNYGPDHLTQQMGQHHLYADSNINSSTRLPHMPQQPMPSRMPTVNGAGHPVHRAHTDSGDSGVAQPEPLRLANMIRAGAAEDPRSPNFGNPGPDRRTITGGRPRRDSSPHNMITSMARQKFTTRDLGLSQSAHAATEPNTNGNAAAFLGTNTIPPPTWFADIQNDFRPTVAQAFEVLPVMEACRAAVASTAGVIHICNLPYTSSRNEVIAFLGRTVQLINQPLGAPYFAVHIMMDRHTGKTNNCFVEVSTLKEAMWVVAQFRKRANEGRHAKIGNREVRVEISSQEELMSELFPLAKNVKWAGAMPIIDRSADFYYTGVKSAGFNGFLQDEELVHMAKHAETPQRSPFAQRCLIRVYESLISTLHKYPWFAVDGVMLHERRTLFDVTLRSIRALMISLKKTVDQHEKTKPTPAILQELVVAALTCPGFSESQKSIVIYNVTQGGYPNFTNGRGMNIRFGGNHKFARDWPFAVLAKKPGVADEFVEYFAGLLRDASAGTGTLSLADLHSMRNSATKPSAFGKIDVEYGDADNLADAGRAELRTIEKLLSFVLPGVDGTSVSSSSMGSV